MSFGKLEESIRNLKDMTELPKLRVRIKELENILNHSNRQNLKERKQLTNEIQRLNFENTKKDEKIKKLEKIKIRYNQTVYNFVEFDNLIKSEVNKVNQYWIAKEASILAEQLLLERVSNEILGYPNRCSPETRRLIEKVADSILGVRIGLTLRGIYTYLRGN